MAWWICCWGTCGLVVCNKKSMGKKKVGPVRKHRAVEASSVDSPPTGSLSHISISEGDRSLPSTSTSCNSHFELPPSRSASRVSQRFSSKRPAHHPRRKGKSSKPKFQLIPQTSLPSLPLAHFKNMVTLIH